MKIPTDPTNGTSVFHIPLLSPPLRLQTYKPYQDLHRQHRVSYKGTSLYTALDKLHFLKQTRDLHRQHRVSYKGASLDNALDKKLHFLKQTRDINVNI